MPDKSFLFEFIRSYFFQQVEIPPKTGILVACSGGPDSVALVQLLASMKPALPFKFRLAHINHHLRGNASNQDERFVRNLAGRVGWPFFRADGRIQRYRGNLEEQARDCRYRALAKIARRTKCRLIVTAHTMDDQVETILMNIFRGSGVDGLAGMAPLRHFGGSNLMLGRPLLGVSKKELLRFLVRSKLSFRTDQSNSDLNYQRNWLRKRLIPLIEKRNPGFQSRLNQLALIFNDEKEFWSDYLRKMETELLKKYRSGALLDLGGALSYPPAAQRRFFRRILGGDLMTFETIERLRKWMQGPPSSGRIFELRKGWTVERLSKSQGAPSPRLFWFKTPTKKDKNQS